MAMKVLVCDDEQYVCDLLCNLIDWKEMGFDLIGVVHDGMTALEEMRNKNPDIVITDIRMPNISGLELIRRASEEKIQAEFMVISGYKNFDYAYEAINYGVSNYLLKPIQKKDLERNLVKIRNEIRAKQSMEFQISNSTAVLKHHFLKALAEEKLNDFTLEDINFRYNLNFENGFFQFLIFQFDFIYPKAYPEYQKINPLMAMANEMIIDSIREFCYCYATCQQQGQLIVLLNYDMKKEIQRTYFKRLLMRIREQLSVTNLYLITLGVGEKTDDPKRIYRMYKSAQRAVMARLSLGCDRTIVNDGEYEHLPVDEIGTKQEWVRLSQLIEQLDEIRLGEWFEDYKRYVMQAALGKPLAVYDSYEYLLSKYRDYCRHYGINFSEPDQRSTLSSGCYTMHDKERLQWEIKKYLCDVLKNHKKDKAASERTPIVRAREYMEKHICEEMSLDIVAEEVGLNPIYFSALFKRQTGTNFMAYLTAIRLEKAKQYMLETDFSIAEIAQKIGYYDVKYFSRIFKKQNKVTPVQYRKIHGR